MGMVYFSDLEIGSKLPPTEVGPISRRDIVRYVAASHDFNQLYYDDDYAQHVAKRGVVVPAMLVMSYFTKMLLNWTSTAVLRNFSFSLSNFVRPDDSLIIQGIIIEKHPQQSQVKCELWAENQLGKKVATAQVLLVLPQSKDKGIAKKDQEVGLVITGNKKAEEELKPEAQGVSQTDNKTAVVNKKEQPKNLAKDVKTSKEQAPKAARSVKQNATATKTAPNTDKKASVKGQAPVADKKPVQEKGGIQNKNSAIKKDQDGNKGSKTAPQGGSKTQQSKGGNAPKAGNVKAASNKVAAVDSAKSGEETPAAKSAPKKADASKNVTATKKAPATNQAAKAKENKSDKSKVPAAKANNGKEKTVKSAPVKADKAKASDNKNGKSAPVKSKPASKAKK